MLGTLAGDRDAYAYLPESVKRFPSPAGLAERMAAAGFERIRYLVLAGGIIAIHSASRPTERHGGTGWREDREPLLRTAAGDRWS